MPDSEKYYQCFSCRHIGPAVDFIGYSPAEKKLVDICPNCKGEGTKTDAADVLPDMRDAINKAAQREERKRARAQSSFDGLKDFAF